MRDRVLDAAEAVVLRLGATGLTLEAVAAEAGVSKGGLLHHFPTKDRLIEAMVSRCAENWRTCATDRYERMEPGPGRMARALLDQLADAQEWTEQCKRSSSAVFAALAQNPNLIEPMRVVYGDLRDRLAQDGLTPGVGETVIAAMDGLWLYRVLGLATVDQQLMNHIRRTLAPLIAKVPGSCAGETVDPGRKLPVEKATDPAPAPGSVNARKTTGRGKPGPRQPARRAVRGESLASAAPSREKRSRARRGTKPDARGGSA